VCASPLCAGWIVGIVRIGNIITDAYRDRVSLVRTIRFMRIEGAASTGPQRLGFSIGGMVAQEIALQAPDLVRKLILARTASVAGK